MMKILAFILFIGSVTTILAQPTLYRYKKNPVILGVVDSSGSLTYSPNVIFAWGKYHMWYTTRYSDQSEKITYLNSNDGLAWTLVNSDALVPSTVTSKFDTKKVGQASVILDNDTLKMWYMGGGTNVGIIGYAWSLNGKEWTKFDGAGTGKSVYDLTMDGSGADGLFTPNILKIGSTYHMWYSTLFFNPFFTSRISHATSENGKKWTKIPGSGSGGTVIDLGAAGKFDEFSASFPTVVKNSTGYEMWYSGIGYLSSGVGYASSLDGHAWVKKDGHEAKGSVLEDGRTASALLMGTEYKIWYSKDDNSFNYASSNVTTEINSVLALVGLNNFPNPFDDFTEISYNVLNSNVVSIKLYDVLGTEIKTLVNEFQNVGNHTVNFDGSSLHSGIYYYRLEIGKDFSVSRKMVK